jgi:hypothetical protein
MTAFTPWSALAGGMLIGLAAVLLLWLNGRIAGISGIAGGLWFSLRRDRAWRVLFLVGLIAGAALWAGLAPSAPQPRGGFPVSLLLLAGLLVGYGTSMSGGCTSGHGVCGLALLSQRSLAATVVFLVAGMAATFVVRHLLQGA